MNRPRIGIVCNRLASGGGMEAHALSIIASLTSLGYEPVIFTKNHRPVEALSGLEVHSCPTKLIPRLLEDAVFSLWLSGAKRRSGVTALIGFCRNTESDILLCGGTHRGFCARKSKRTLYDTVTSRFEARAYEKARFILPASQLIAYELRSLYQVPEEKIRIAYPPVPTEKFRAFNKTEKLAARAALGLTADKTVLLFPSASGHERKGLPFILDSLKELEHIELAVAGKPPKADNPNVVGIGYQTDMTRAYNAADYTILASYYEPFGLVGVESVLCGTPVLLADGIGCSEVISKNACTTFSRSSPESLHEILCNLRPGARTTPDDIAYDYSAEHQAQMLVSLLSDSHA